MKKKKVTAEDIFNIGMEEWKSFSVHSLMPALRAANNGAREDVLNTNGCRYYQWSSCLIKAINPSQVVELGGAMGVWSICVLHFLSPESKLYSVTLAEDGLEFAYVVDTYTNFVPVVGDDLNLKVWPKELDLKNTDLWFFDSLHTPEQLTKELDLYSPFFKKGTIILFDDIHSFGLQPIWDRIQKGEWGITDTWDASDPLHYTGFGLAIV